MNITNRTKGLALASLGFAFIVLNAIDYLSGSKSNGGLLAVGIMLVVIGMGFSRKK